MTILTWLWGKALWILGVVVALIVLIVILSRCGGGGTTRYMCPGSGALVDKLADCGTPAASAPAPAAAAPGTPGAPAAPAAPPASSSAMSADEVAKVLAATSGTYGTAVYPTGTQCGCTCCPPAAGSPPNANVVAPAPASAPAPITTNPVIVPQASAPPVTTVVTQQPPAPSCPKTVADVLALGLPNLTKLVNGITVSAWVDESGPSDVCHWQAHGVDVPLFTVQSGVEVDYDAGGQPGRACASNTVPAYHGDITGRFVFTTCVPNQPGFTPQQQPTGPVTTTTTAQQGAPAGAYDKSPTGLAANPAIPAGCSVSKALPPNGAQFTCKASVSFTVPTGFVVQASSRFTAGQLATGSVFSFYDDR